MPTSLTIGVFVLGAVLLIMALTGGGFKLFGQEVRGQARGLARFIAGVLGITFVGLAVLFGPITSRLGDMINGTAVTVTSIPPGDASPPPDSDDAILTQEAEEGPATLNGSWSAELQGLTVTVTQVERVRIEDGNQSLTFTVEVSNATTDSVSLPLSGGFVVAGDDGRIYEPDPSTSEWPDQFPAGSTHTGQILLGGVVGDSLGTVELRFQPVVEGGTNGQITIENVPVP